MKADHIHTPKDGRGPRDVFVNGKLVEQVFFADTRRGIVRAYKRPLRLDKWRKRLLSATLHGLVEVRAKVGAGETAPTYQETRNAMIRDWPRRWLDPNEEIRAATEGHNAGGQVRR